MASGAFGRAARVLRLIHNLHGACLAYDSEEPGHWNLGFSRVAESDARLDVALIFTLKTPGDYSICSIERPQALATGEVSRKLDLVIAGKWRRHSGIQ